MWQVAQGRFSRISLRGSFPVSVQLLQEPLRSVRELVKLLRQRYRRRQLRSRYTRLLGWVSSPEPQTWLTFCFQVSAVRVRLLVLLKEWVYGPLRERLPKAGRRASNNTYRT